MGDNTNPYAEYVAGAIPPDKENPYAQFVKGAQAPQQANPYAQFVEGAPPIPQPVTAQEAVDSAEAGTPFIEHGAGEYATDIATAVPAGALDSVEATGDLVTDTVGVVADKIGTKLPLGFALGRDYIAENIPGGDGWFEMVWTGSEAQINDPLFGKLHTKDAWGAESETLPGNLVRGATNFLVSFIGVGKFAKGGAAVAGIRGATTTGGKLLAGGAQGATAAFVGVAPEDPNLSDFIQTFPSLENPITGYLASSPDDTTWDKRMKNAIEDVFAGAVATGIFMTLRAWRKALSLRASGDTKAAEETLEAAREEVRQLDLFDDAPDATGVEKAAAPAAAKEATPATGLEKGDTQGAAVKEATPASGVAVDADAILKNVRVATAEGVTFDADASWFNRSKWDSPEDVGNLVDLTADKLSGRLDDLSKEGHKSFEEMRTEAAKWLSYNLNVGFDAVLQGFAKGGETKDMVSRMLAGKAMIQSIARDIKNIAARIDVEGGKEADMLLLLKREEQLEDMVVYVKGVQREAARATAAGRIRTHDSVSGAQLASADVLDQIAKNGGSEAMRLRARRILAARNTKAIIDNNRRSVVRRVMDGVNEWWINSILSGPWTHIVNSASNAGMTFLAPAEKMLGAVGGPRGFNREAFMEGYSQLMALRSAAKDSAKMFAAAMRTGRNILDPNMAKYEVPTRAIHSDADNVIGSMIRGVGTITRIPSRFLLSADEFFSQLNYRAALTGKLKVEAARRFPGNTTKQAEWFATAFDNSFKQYDAATGTFTPGGSSTGTLRDILRRDFDPSRFGQAGDKRALVEAQETIFTKDLRGTPTYSGAASFGEAFQRLTTAVPPLKLVAPFVRTPTNIVRMVWDRSPGLNLLRKEYMDQLSAGGIEAAKARGKLMTGAAFYTSAYMMWSEGHLTGAGPLNPNEKARLYDDGWKPYAFVFTGEDGKKVYIQFNRADPMGMFFGLVADLGASGILGGEAEYENAATAAVVALSNNLSNKTYMKGISDAVEAWGNGAGAFERWARSTAKGFIPYSAAMSQIGGAVGADDTMREARTIVDGMMSRMPYFSTKLPPKRSWITGETIPLSQATHWINKISPYQVSEGSGDHTLEVLAELQHGWEAPNPIIAGVNLADEHPFLYDRYLQLVASPPGRPSLLNALRREIDRAGFDLEKEKALLADDAPGSRVDQIIRRYRDWGKRALMREEPWLRDADREYRAVQRDARHGEQDAIDRLLEQNKR